MKNRKGGSNFLSRFVSKSCTYFKNARRKITMKNMKIFSLILIAALLATSLLFAGGEKEKVPEVVGKPFAGVTLHYLGPDEIHNALLQAMLPAFEEETGITVVAEILPMDTSMQKTMLECSKGSSDYDLMNIATYDNSVYYYNGWFVNLDDMERKTGLSFHREEYVEGLWEAVMQLNGVTYALPIILANVGPVQFRTDLMNDSGEKAAFKRQYGYELAPPTNWDQFYDIAEFFTRDTDNDGEIDFWGCSLTLDSGGAIWDQWILRYLTSTVPADASKTYSYLFTDKLEPRFNSRAGIRAIEDLKRLCDDGYVYPGYLTMGWDQVNDGMSLGKVFMTYAWAETLSPALNPKYNQYADVTWWAPRPIYEENRMEIGAWLIGINEASKKKEAAYEFIVWITNAENEYKQCTMDIGAKLGTRKSNFENEEIYKLHPEFAISKKMIETSETLPELFLPEVAIVQTVLNVELQRVIIGEKTGKEALDYAAKEIKKQMMEAGAYERVK
jgi:multiple sugar transport system substrate-binding protein